MENGSRAADTAPPAGRVGSVSHSSAHFTTQTLRTGLTSVRSDAVVFVPDKSGFSMNVTSKVLAE